MSDNSHVVTVIIGDTIAPPVVSPDPKIDLAIEFALRYGQIDGAHHKTWVIDQMVRALCGCPVEQRNAKDVNGVSYSYGIQANNRQYDTIIEFYRNGDEYEWSEGTPP